LQEEIHADRNQIVDTCKRLNKIYLQDEYIKLDHNATLREQVAQLKAQLNQLNQVLRFGSVCRFAVGSASLTL
jgi:hypothetical protein